MSSSRTQRQYVAILALISAGILIVGSKLRPDSTPEVPVTQAEMARLQGLTQRQNLESQTAYFSQVANRVKPAVFWLEGIGHSGVLWGASGQVVTAGPRLLPSDSVTAVGVEGRFPLQPQVLSPAYAAASLQSDELTGFVPVFHGAARTLERGSWIVHVSATESGDYLAAPGSFKGVVPADCGAFRVDEVVTSLPLSKESLGGGVFSLAGDLLGLVLDCEGGPAAITSDGIDTILKQANSFEGQLLRRYGFRVQELTDRDQKHFGTETGLLVTEVVLDLPAARAGLTPGDVIQAMDDTPVSVPDDLARLALPMAYPSYRLSVRRRGRLAQLDMKAADSDLAALNHDAVQGIGLGRPAEGFLIQRVTPGSSAERASLESGDRLLSVNGRAIASRQEAAKLLGSAGDEQAFVVVQRGDRQLGVFLEQ